MPCAAHQKALTEAAAGATSNAALDRHLIVCADCRAFLAAERELYAAIDLWLRRVGNARVPPSLTPALRASLEKQAPERRWFLPALVPLAAALVAALLVARAVRPPAERPSLAATVSTREPISPERERG